MSARVPAEAIAAAVSAARHYGHRRISEHSVSVMLEAAAPLIADAIWRQAAAAINAERERIRQMALDDANAFADDWIHDAAETLRDFAAKLVTES